MTFQEAYKRLEQIYKLLQDEKNIDIDKIFELQKEAKDLYDFCSEKLSKK